MTESEPVSQPRDRRVQAALEAYLERMDRGEAVDRDAFLAEHAEIADELRSFLETDEDLARLAGETSTSSAARRDAATLVPQRVQGKSSATDSGQLPAQFGRYRVLKPLGSGAMGTVFLAEDTQLQRKVALKTPSFDEDDSGELLERFYREARAAAVLRHSNICPVFDVDQIDGRHFISMAWIEGRTLSAYIQPDNPQPERQILLIIRKLALALREAHEQGIVHRDLKPGNIIIDPRGEPIIMDFGLARRVTTDEDNRITQSGVLVGSPAYMSPEQVEGEPDRIGPASDQYSLGVILYEMLTGQLPFRGSITGVIGQILTKKPTPPGKLRADLDPRIESLCRRMMAKQANERFPSVKDVADEVARILKTPRSDAARSAATGGSANAQSTPDAPSLRVAVTDSNVASLYEAARKCMRKRDYEQVVQILETLPEHKRNEDVVKLLAKARQLSDEVQFLLAEIDEALRLNDVEAALKKSDELLKLRPGHHRAKQVKEECSRYGSGLLFWRKRQTVDGRRVGEGSWIPWAAIAVFLVAFGATSWLVYDYLNSDGTVLDPDPSGENGEIDDGPAPELAVAPFDADEAPRHQQQWADYLNSPVEFSNSLGMTFRLIPAGEFEMGSSDEMIEKLLEEKAEVWDESLQPHYDWRARVRSELPLHRVRLTSSFYLGVHEVTEQQFHDVMQTPGADPDESGLPVSGVSWLDAVEFCNRLSAREGRSPCYARNGDEVTLLDGDGYRLPTEAEWEFACRAGTITAYPFGDLEDESDITEYGWVFNNARGSVQPVGELQPNAFGLYDMLGNVKEWVWDWYGEDYYSQPASSGDDPLGPDSGPQRVSRGGYANRDPASCRPASRYPSTSDGLRVVLAGIPDALPEGIPSPAVAPFDAALAEAHQTAWGDYLGLPTELAVDLGDGIQMQFSLIPAGRAPLGLPARERDAEITSAFYIGVCEVDQEQFEQVMGINPSERKASERPVHNVTWHDAVAFCQRLSESPEHSAAGYVFRLPTEAEWEYACRAGSTAAWSFGDDASRLGEYAWFAENADSTMHPVGQKAENAWGLYDMHANVWEWCRDSLNGDRPIRGGCWYSKADLCRAGYRREIPASNDSILVGFRVVLEIDASAAGGDDWTDLFNGRDLTGWTPVQSAGGWRVTNGVLHCDDQGNGWLATQREFGDFELELDLKLPAQGNSGVFLRVPRDAAPNGAGLLEVQLLDDTAARFDGIQANQHTGALYGIVAPDPQVSVEPDVWHSLRIQAVALRIIVDVDGQQVIDADLEDYPQLAQQKPNALRTSGFIGLQRHQSAAEFRNIRIQESRSAIERDALLLQGTWRAVGQEIAGNTWTPEQIEEHEKTIKFTGNTFEIRNLDRTGRFQIERGTYELDPTRDPPHITMNGTNREGRAIEFLGICQIEGDQLRHCFVKTSDDPDAPRPTSFPTSSGTGQFSTTYRRDRGGESGVQRIPFPESASFTDARSLSELNEPGIINAYPWISTDGLTLYWTREGDGTSSIRQASRASLDAPFGSATTVLADARLASVSPDGLEIVCLFDADGDGNSAELCSGRRSVAGVVFGRPTVIESLRSLNRPKGTAFGSDGLSLLILESGDPDTGLRNRILISRRPDTGADWEAAEPVTIQGSIDRDSLTWPSFDALGDHLLFSFSEEGSRYLEWGGVADRTDGSLMFNNARPLLLEGDRFVTRGGRYCAASGELFFTHPVGTPPYQEMQLWVAHAQN